MISTGLALGFWTDEICSIAVGLKNHVAGSIDDFSIRVADGIVEEVDGVVVGGLDICAGGNVVEGVHHGVVNCSGIETNFSGYLLEELDFLRCEGRPVVNLAYWMG